MKKIDTPVLVLDRAYMPLNIVTSKKAFAYLIRNKATVVEEVKDKFFHSDNKKWPAPSIIKLSEFMARGTYNKIKVRFNKRSLLERDKFTCQYCQKTLSRDQATVDHVIPRGGKYKGTTVWKNCVISCLVCNTKKGNRTPEEANMKLNKIPKVPHYLFHLSSMLERHSNNKLWKQYFIS